MRQSRFGAGLVWAAAVLIATLGGPARAADETTISIGVSPSVVSAAAYLALQKEFAEQGLKVNMVTLQSGAEAIPRLMNGELAFAFGDTTGTITAASNGVPLINTGVGTIGASTADRDMWGLITRKDIATASDLAGRTVAVNQLNGTNRLSVMEAVAKRGGDPAKIQFVELPYPQMADAVTAKRVDGALAAEPFLSAGKRSGLDVLMSPQADSVAALPTVVIVSTKSYVSSHPDIVKRFNAALSAAGVRANADGKLVRQVVGTYTKVPQPTIDAMVLPIFSEHVGDVEGMRKVVVLMNKYKMLDRQPDMNALLAK